MQNARTVLPGFNISLGYSVVYLSIIVLIPLAAVFMKSFGIGWHGLLDILKDQRILHALFLSFSTAFCAAFTNVLLGTLTAWCLVRYDFPAKKLICHLLYLRQSQALLSRLFIPPTVGYLMLLIPLQGLRLHLFLLVCRLLYVRFNLY